MKIWGIAGVVGVCSNWQTGAGQGNNGIGWQGVVQQVRRWCMHPGCRQQCAVVAPGVG